MNNLSIGDSATLWNLQNEDLWGKQVVVTFVYDHRYAEKGTEIYEHLLTNTYYDVREGDIPHFVRHNQLINLNK